MIFWEQDTYDGRLFLGAFTDALRVFPFLGEIYAKIKGVLDLLGDRCPGEGVARPDSEAGQWEHSPSAATV